MIELKNLKKTFNAGTVNENPAIRGVDLKIEKGDFITVIGSNGAGKSTLLNLLAGYLTPDSGQVIVNYSDVSKVSKP